MPCINDCILYDKILAFIIISLFICSLSVGLILTFTTSAGINDGAIPLTVAACTLMLIISMFIYYKIIQCCDRHCYNK